MNVKDESLIYFQTVGKYEPGKIVCLSYGTHLYVVTKTCNKILRLKKINLKLNI